MNFCETADCEAFAIFLMVWPGKEPMRVCLVDGARAAEIAEVMGFKLDIRLIEGASIYGKPLPPSLRSLLEID